MQQRDASSRRLFFQILAGLGAGLFGWSWFRLSRVQTGVEHRSEFRHAADLPLGVSYFGKYYLYRDQNGLRAFSTSCTHAGCRLGGGNGGYLSCGCHGSRFEAATGKPVKGPAYQPLQELECYFDRNVGQWIIKMHSATT